MQEQIRHRETELVPYTPAFESEVETRLDEHYGGEAWSERLTLHIAQSEKIAVVVKNERLPRIAR